MREDEAMFQNPPAMYRPAPLWVWNDDISEAKLLEASA